MRLLTVIAAMFFLSNDLCVAQEAGKLVLIVYHSVTGNTEVMANSVEKGVKSVPGVTAKRLPVDEVEWDDVAAADALILGSPVHNANVATPVQEFINSWPFDPNALRDKIGAAFVSASGISAGEELAQLAMLHSMLIFGMIVVGGESWQSPFGASAILEEAASLREGDSKDINAHFLEKAEGLGKRVAEIVLRMD